jgi:hypothetical protein
LLPEIDEGSSDLSGDEYAMEHILAHFGDGAVSLKAIAIEKDASAAGDHEFVVGLTKKSTSETEFVKIFVENIPQDLDGNSFCTDFLDYEFVRPFTKIIVAFE